MNSSAAADWSRPRGRPRSGDTSNNVWDLLAANGYTVLNDRDSIMALKNEAEEQGRLHQSLAAGRRGHALCHRPERN